MAALKTDDMKPEENENEEGHAELSPPANGSKDPDNNDTEEQVKKKKKKNRKKKKNGSGSSVINLD